MYQEQTEDKTIYAVVVNDEEQYSIWPDARVMPRGWRKAGKTGLKEECLAFIREVWVDMRPRSLRIAMSELKSADLAASRESVVRELLRSDHDCAERV
jgi:MbtH protein